MCVCLSVRTFLNKVGKLQAILIIEANTEGITLVKELGLQVQSCGFARVPKFGKSMKKT
jgi:hypothetical protein